MKSSKEERVVTPFLVAILKKYAKGVLNSQSVPLGIKKLIASMTQCKKSILRRS